MNVVNFIRNSGFDINQFKSGQYLVYVLKLEQNKYYVGDTYDFVNRCLQHITGQGSRWTREYPPIKIEQIIYNKSEHQVTLDYMNLYGIDNVRGAEYVSYNLSQAELVSIRKTLDTFNRACFRCHQRGHFAYQCPQTKCFNCSGHGHWSNNCPGKNIIPNIQEPEIRIEIEELIEIPITRKRKRITHLRTMVLRSRPIEIYNENEEIIQTTKRIRR